MGCNCTSGLVIVMFDDSDKVGTDVLFLHGRPQSCTSNPVEGLLEVCEDTVEVSLVLEVFFTKGSQVEDLFCGAHSCYEAYLWAVGCTGRNRTLPPPRVSQLWVK